MASESEHFYLWFRIWFCCQVALQLTVQSLDTELERYGCCILDRVGSRLFFLVDFAGRWRLSSGSQMMIDEFPTKMATENELSSCSTH